MIMEETLTVKIDSEVKKQAKLLAVKTGYTLRELVEMLLRGLDEDAIIKLAKKQGK